MPGGNGIAHCDVCDVDMPSLGTVLHVRGKRHRKKTKTEILKLDKKGSRKVVGWLKWESQ